MCGIIGIASNKKVSTNIVNALKKLEYRGYDSAGLATIANGEINEKKCSGRVEKLEKILFQSPNEGNLGIGHVRWATHGVPNEINAHPHSSEIVSVVHNGIIENSDQLKKEFEKSGTTFKSQTDTEVITVLLTEKLKKLDPLKAVFETIDILKGSFALGIIFKNHKNFVIGARRGSPLAVGYSNNENYLGSDSYALKSMTNKISYLNDGDVCVLSKDEVKLPVIFCVAINCCSEDLICSIYKSLIFSKLSDADNICVLYFLVPSARSPKPLAELLSFLSPSPKFLIVLASTFTSSNILSNC